MSEFSGPIINKVRGGIGRREPSDDAVAGLIAGGVATANYSLGSVVQLNSTQEAEALGINAAYDANNKILVWNHIKRFFTYAPNGTLFLKLVARGTTLTQMCDVATDNLFTLITSPIAERKIKFVGVVLNPVNTYAPVSSNGFDADVLAAIPKAQELVSALKANAIFIDNIALEGRLTTNATINTIRDCSTYAADSVSVVIAQDPIIASLMPEYGNYAAVGDLLGMIAIRKVSECLGSLNIVNKPEQAKTRDTYSLTNLANNFWLSASLSNGKAFSSLTNAEKESLKGKRLIYAGQYEGVDGCYFSDSHTCIQVSDDYAYIEDNRVWNKAARLVRRALLPLMKSEIEVNASTGALSASQIAFYEVRAKGALTPMIANAEIAGEPTVIIDGNQNVIATGSVTLGINYVRKGILRNLTGNIAATNPSA